MIKIFLTGASGKLGKTLYPFLKKNFNVFAVSYKNKFKFTDKLNLTDSTNLMKKLDNFSPDVIIHLASLTNIDECEKKLDLTYKTNISVIENIARWCLKKKTRLIYISTDQVYNNYGVNKENDPVYPVNFYSLSKLIAEKIVSKLNNVIILRTNFFGYFPEHKGSLINWFLNELKKKKKINLVKDITFNPLYVETLCLLIKKIILKKKIKGIYNLGAQNKISKGMLLYKLGKQLGFKSNLFNFVKSEKIKFFANRSKNMHMSVKKIENTLKIKMPKIEDELNLLINKINKNYAI